MAFDPQAFLGGSAPARPAPATTVQGRTTQLNDLFAQRAPAPVAQPEPTAPAGFDPTSFLNDEEAPEAGMLESFGRGALQGVTLGFSDEIYGALASAFSDKSYTEARDESRRANKAAQEANPWSYGIGEVGGGIALPGFGAGGAAAKLGLKGLTKVAAVGAAEGALQGVGTAEGDVSDSIKGALTGAAVGGVTAGVAGKVFGKYADDAVRRAERNTTKELTEGAIPTQSRRFADVQELGFEVLQPDKKFMAAAKAKPEDAQAIAKARLNVLGPQTKPIYDKLDEQVGKVDVLDVVRHFDARKAELGADFRANPALEGALEEAKDEFVRKATNKYKPAEGAPLEVTHKDVREWVTQLYKHKFKKLGTISETENADLAAEAFAEADGFLKGRLNSYREQFPDLVPELDKLTQLNRQIKAWAAAESLMEHKAGREFWKQDGLSKIISGKAQILGGTGGAIAAAATGSFVPLAVGAVAPFAARGALAGVRRADRATTAALARLVKAAQAGDAKKQLALDALKAGVPLATALGVLNTMKNRPAWVNELGRDDE